LPATSGHLQLLLQELRAELLLTEFLIEVAKSVITAAWGDAAVPCSPDYVWHCSYSPLHQRARETFTSLIHFLMRCLAVLTLPPTLSHLK